MTRDEAEDYVYRSYLRAQPHLDWAAPDAEKRHPELTRALLRGMAPDSARTVVVTGSKGKGSVARMAAAILGTAGHVGLMTSPHILRFNERFSVDGRDVTDEEFVSAVEAVRPKIDAICRGLPEGEFVSPVGIETAVALRVFAAHGADFTVLECGKGARYDDVTNVPHERAVINSVFLEHTRELGPTVEAIAEDKAAVLGNGCRRAFVGSQQPAAQRVIERAGREVGVSLACYGRDFRAGEVSWSREGIAFDVSLGGRVVRDVRLPAFGSHQARNAALALALCRDLLGSRFDGDAARDALAHVRLAGRLEPLSRDPLVLLDACVNRASCAGVLETLAHLGVPRVTCVIGIPADKDGRGVAEAMRGVAAGYVLTASHNPHYRFDDGLARELAAQGADARYVPEVRDALDAALAAGLPVVVLGTTSVVAEVEALCSEGYFSQRKD